MYLLLIFLPLIGSLCAGLFDRKLGPFGASYITASCLILTFLMSLFVFYEVALLNCCVYIKLAPWINSEILHVDWGFLFDSLTVVMCCVVTYFVRKTFFTFFYFLIFFGLQLIFDNINKDGEKYFSFISVIFTFCIILLLSLGGFSNNSVSVVDFSFIYCEGYAQKVSINIGLLEVLITLGLIYFIGWKKVILCGHWYKIVTFKTPAKRKDVNGIRTGMPYFYDTGNGFTRYEAEWYGDFNRWRSRFAVPIYVLPGGDAEIFKEVLNKMSWTELQKYREVVYQLKHNETMSKILGRQQQLEMIDAVVQKKHLLNFTKYGWTTPKFDKAK